MADGGAQEAPPAEPAPPEAEPEAKTDPKSPADPQDPQQDEEDGIRSAAEVSLWAIVRLMSWRSRHKLRRARKQRFRTLATFVPTMLIAEHVANRQKQLTPAATDFQGALLMADLCGFTKLSEQLGAGAGHPGGRTSQPDLSLPPSNWLQAAVARAKTMRRDNTSTHVASKGAEQLQRILTEYFGLLMEHITAYDGDVLRVAGDAVMVVFGRPGDDVTEHLGRAAQCALDMMRKYDQTMLHGRELRLHSALAVGELTLYQLGGNMGDWQYLVQGPAVAQLPGALDDSQPGDVVVSPQAWGVLQPVHGAEGERLPSGNARVQALANAALGPVRFLLREELLEQHTDWLEESVGAFVPAPITAAVAAENVGWTAEIRRVSVLFLVLSSPDPAVLHQLEGLQRVFSFMQQTLHEHEAVIKEFSVDDKGMVVVAGLGLPPLVGDVPPLRAVRAAMVLVDGLSQLGCAGYAGVTTGQAFVGSVGKERRREFAIVGDTVNTAARLMGAAKKATLAGEAQRTVYVDKTTRDAAQESIIFSEATMLTLKGKEHEQAAYAPLRGRSSLDAVVHDVRRATFGRDAERAQLRSFLHDLWRGKACLCALTGVSGIGKSHLAAEVALDWRRMTGRDVLRGFGIRASPQPLQGFKPVLLQLFKGWAPAVFRMVTEGEVDTAGLESDSDGSGDDDEDDEEAEHDEEKAAPRSSGEEGDNDASAAAEFARMAAARRAKAEAVAKASQDVAAMWDGRLLDVSELKEEDLDDEALAKMGDDDGGKTETKQVKSKLLSGLVKRLALDVELPHWAGAFGLDPTRRDSTEARGTFVKALLRCKLPAFEETAPLLNGLLDMELDLSERMMDMNGAQQLKSAEALLHQLVHIACKEEPQVLVVEDAQWCDLHTVTVVKSISQLPNLFVLICTRPFDTIRRGDVGRTQLREIAKAFAANRRATPAPESASAEAVVEAMTGGAERPRRRHALAPQASNRMVAANGGADEVDGIEDAVGELLRNAKAARIVVMDLPGLDLEATSRLACIKLATPQVSKRVRFWLQLRSDGNPQFVSYFAAMLEEHGLGTMRGTDSVWELYDADNAPLDTPADFRDRVNATIGALTQQQQLVLKVSAVIGHRVSLRVLHKLFPVHAAVGQLFLDLHALHGMRLLRFDKIDPDVTENSIFSFASFGVQEVVYNSMPFGNRRQLHAQVAGYFEERFEGLTEAEEVPPHTPPHDPPQPAAHATQATVVPLLVHHWSMAENETKALLLASRHGRPMLQASLAETARAMLPPAQLEEVMLDSGLLSFVVALVPWRRGVLKTLRAMRENERPAKADARIASIAASVMSPGSPGRAIRRETRLSQGSGPPPAQMDALAAALEAQQEQEQEKEKDELPPVSYAPGDAKLRIEIAARAPWAKDWLAERGMALPPPRVRVDADRPRGLQPGKPLSPRTQEMTPLELEQEYGPIRQARVDAERRRLRAQRGQRQPDAATESTWRRATGAADAVDLGQPEDLELSPRFANLRVNRTPRSPGQQYTSLDGLLRPHLRTLLTPHNVVPAEPDEHPRGSVHTAYIRGQDRPHLPSYRGELWVGQWEGKTLPQGKNPEQLEQERQLLERIIEHQAAAAAAKAALEDGSGAGVLGASGTCGAASPVAELTHWQSAVQKEKSPSPVASSSSPTRGRAFKVRTHRGQAAKRRAEVDEHERQRARLPGIAVQRAQLSPVRRSPSPPPRGTAAGGPGAGAGAVAVAAAAAGTAREAVAEARRKGPPVRVNVVNLM